MAEQRKKLRLGELLIQQGLITADQLRIALTEQKNHQMPIGRLLVRLGFVTESAIRDTDFSEETANLTRSQILSQAATTVLAQANSAPQAALSLLR